MLYIAPLIWLATLLRSSFAQAICGAAYILATITWFPSYLFELWSDELENLTWLFGLIAWCNECIGGLHEDIDEMLVDAKHYISVTLPMDFHDTFGDLLGDVTRKQWNDFFSAMLVIGIITAIWYACKRLAEAAATPSPSPLATEGSPAKAREPPPTPSQPTPATSKPMFFEHFRGDVEYFKQAGVYYPLTYNLPSHISFLHPPSSTRVVSYTPEVEPLITSPMKEPGGAQGVCVPSDQTQTPVPSSRTPRKSPDVAPSQADNLLAPSSKPTPDNTSKGGPPLATQHDIPPMTVQMVCHEMKEHTNELNVRIQAFLQGAENKMNIHASLVSLERFLLAAYSNLPSQLTPMQVLETGWVPCLQFFWDTVQPHGHSRTDLYGDKM